MQVHGDVEGGGDGLEETVQGMVLPFDYLIVHQIEIEEILVKMLLLMII